MFNQNLIGRWMAAILALVGIIYLVVPLLTRGPVGHIPPSQRPGATAQAAGTPLRTTDSLQSAPGHAPASVQ